MKNQDTVTEIKITIVPADERETWPGEAISASELGTHIVQKLAAQYPSEQGKRFSMQVMINDELCILEERIFTLENDHANTAHKDDYTRHYWIENL